MRLSVILLLLWLISSITFDLNKIFLPEAIGVSKLFIELTLNGVLFGHLGITLYRVMLGVFFSIIIGVPIGLWMRRIPLVRKELGPIFEFIRGIPTSMLFPIFIVFFGFGELSKILIAIYLAMPIIIVNSMVGATPRRELQGRFDYLSIHQDLIPKKQHYFAITWQAAPSVISSIKVAISLGLVVILVTEMFFVASSGVAWAAFRAYKFFQIDLMYLYVITSVFAALILNKIFDFAIQRVGKS